MIDIYDEIGYIKNILEHGLSSHWERDAILLARYYKMEGMKKSEIKEKIKEKCISASKRRNNPIVYDHNIAYERLNRIIDTAWKKETKLRQIQYIDISKEVLEWFLGLEENVVLNDEQVQEIKKNRPKISIKKNRPMNFNRTKYLFTLYIWTKVQENYLDKPNMHYLGNYMKRFKEDANLKQSFNMSNERNLMYDLGFIDVNFGLGIKAKFIEDNQVFQIPITDDNRIRINTGEPEDGDLYHCGYWLEKQKMGKFVCQICGKEFAHYNNSTREKARKYCKDCYNTMNGSSGKNVTMDGKDEDGFYRFCVDCGDMFRVNNDHDMKRCRCEHCNSVYKAEQTRLRVQKLRKKMVLVNGGLTDRRTDGVSE